MDRVLAARDRLVSSLRFQRIVSSVPGLRKIAQNQAKDVFDLLAGFVYSQTLSACVELGLLQTLLEAPRSVEELARMAQLPTEGMERLVAAAVSLKILSRRSGGRVGLGMRGAAIAGNPGLIGMIEHHRMFYRDLADPVALLQGRNEPTELSRYWGYAGSDGRTLNGYDVAAYSDLMSASQSLVADTVIGAYPFAKHKRMLDAGGGDGTFITRVAAQHPHLQFIHFDLPAVSARARAKFESAGLSGRTQCVSGSFVDDGLPDGADIVTLVRILHDHSDLNVTKILTRARAAVMEGGVLLVAEPLAGTRGAESMGDAYFGFYLMAMGKGRPRTKHELEAMLRDAGFSQISEIASPIPLQTRILAAKA
jgi:demethylspheroidene O-methyltransferase